MNERSSAIIKTGLCGWNKYNIYESAVANSHIKTLNILMVAEDKLIDSIRRYKQ